ncbi:unnamed protein product [Owenia fusiformis]|uniref:Uncharacterized protein n=1 Tax=Owenia fusiformis TaxID=6347 RepID=A0A8J1U5L6_OWEFU|nr:unnamed protein product [Owenia fusiformis]
MRICVAILVLFLIQETHTGKGDKGKKDKKKKKESGTEVVDAALEKLKKYSETGQKFLRNIACVESKYGTDKNTYRKNYHGGIWQVDEVGFKDTQDTKSHPKLKERFKKIKELYGIDWEKVEWKDLRKPFYSALAARLLLQNKADALPPEDDIRKQGEYWKKHYNTEDGAGTVDDFVKRVEECNKKENKEQEKKDKEEKEKERAEKNETETEEQTPDKPDDKKGQDGNQTEDGIEWDACPIGPDVSEWERLLPDPQKCNHFYHCNTEGWAWSKPCPIRENGTLLRLYWNDELKLCDWPENVDCTMIET